MTSSQLAFLFLGQLLAALTVGAQPAPATAPLTVPPLSPALADIVRLVEAGIEESVTLAFIRDTHTPYQLTARTIPYLRDLGISAALLTAMLEQDRQGQEPAPARFEPVRLTPANSATSPPRLPEEATEPPDYETNAPPEAAPFYDQLSPFGAWAVLPTVGWCWQPRAVVLNPGWQPYCDGGHWVYTAAGWYWQADYSWGAAAFHYGRWHRDEQSGWVWAPDTQWGPAWVTWRKTGQICGWAPLPPGAGFSRKEGYWFRGQAAGADCAFALPEEVYTFVELAHFSDRDLVGVRLPPATAHLFFGRTAVVNSLARADELTSTNRHEPPAAMLVSAPGDGWAARFRPPPANPVRAQRVNAQHPLIQHAALVPPAPINRAWLPVAQPDGSVAMTTLPGAWARLPKAEFGPLARVSEHRPAPPASLDSPGAPTTTPPLLPRGAAPFPPAILPANPRIYVPRQLPRPAEISTARPAYSSLNPNPTEGLTKHP